MIKITKKEVYTFENEEDVMKMLRECYEEDENLPFNEVDIRTMFSLNDYSDILNILNDLNAKNEFDYDNLTTFSDVLIEKN